MTAPLREDGRERGVGREGGPGRGPGPRTLLAVLVALIVLAAVSLALRFAHLGSFSYAVALGIAAIKGALVVVFFMEVFHEKVTARFAFITGISLFALLMLLTLADVLTRSIPPLENPPGTGQRYHG